MQLSDFKAKADESRAEAATTGDWKSVGTPVTDDAGNVYMPQENSKTGQTRFSAVETPAGAGKFSKLGAVPLPPEKQPVPSDQVSSFASDIKDEYPLLTFGRVQALQNCLGPNPTQGDLAKAESAANSMQDAAQRAADLKEQRERGISDADPRRKTAADAATNREIDNAQKRVKIALDKSDAKIENLQEAVGMLDQPNGEKDAQWEEARAAMRTHPSSKCTTDKPASEATSRKRS